MPGLRFFALAVALACCWPGPALAQATLGGDWRSDVDAFARRVVDQGLVPGLSLAVVQGDWVLHARALGAADLATGRPVTEASAFYIASSTKALTATAALMMVHRKELDLDAPLTRYLPKLTFKAPLSAKEVTVRKLLTMTHGIEDGGPVVFRTAYTGEQTPQQLLALLSDYGPAETGSAFAYGNIGYNLLGLVLEARSGRGWKEVVDREMLGPLGMAETTAWLSKVAPDRLALPHEAGPAGFRRAELAKDDANLHAAGGHFATARDLARFLAAQLSGGLVEGRRALPGEPLELSRRQHVAQERDFNGVHRTGWGFGWDLGTWNGDVLVHRFGSFAGYRSHLSFMPEHGLGVVVLVNGGGPASEAADLVARYVYDRLLSKPGLEGAAGGQLEALAKRAAEQRQALAAQLEKRKARLAPLAHPLEAYAGAYENPRMGRMEWRVVAQGLEVRAGAARSRAEVFDAAKDALRVELTGAGEVVGFEFPGEGGPARALVYSKVRFERAAAAEKPAGAAAAPAK